MQIKRFVFKQRLTHNGIVTLVRKNSTQVLSHTTILSILKLNFKYGFACWLQTLNLKEWHQSSLLIKRIKCTNKQESKSL